MARRDVKLILGSPLFCKVLSKVNETRRMISLLDHGSIEQRYSDAR